MIEKSWNSFVFAWRGLKTVWKEERNFRIEVIVAFLVILFEIYYKFYLIGFVFSAIAITFVLTAETINTAVEDLCNKVEPNQDPVIGKIKDISSAFVLLSVIGALVVGILVFYNHFA